MKKKIIIGMIIAIVILVVAGYFLVFNQDTNKTIRTDLKKANEKFLECELNCPETTIETGVVLIEKTCSKECGKTMTESLSSKFTEEQMQEFWQSSEAEEYKKEFENFGKCINECETQETFLKDCLTLCKNNK